MTRTEYGVYSITQPLLILFKAILAVIDGGQHLANSSAAILAKMEKTGQLIFYTFVFIAVVLRKLCNILTAT